MIATSIKQSKKLLELGVNPETADMWYSYYGDAYCSECGKEMRLKMLHHVFSI